MTKIKVLVVDESVMVRDCLKEALEDLPDIELCGAAPTSATGLARARLNPPDIVVLSTGVPDRAPDQFVRRVVSSQLPRVGVILLAPAKPTSEAVDLTVRALEAGAVDFVSKPDCSDADGDAGEVLARRLLPKIRSLSAATYSREAKRVAIGGSRDPSAAVVGSVSRASALAKTTGPAKKLDVIVIGVSTGGPEALSILFASLPPLAVPVVVVIHMPPQFTTSLVRALGRKVALPVCEAADGEFLEGGMVHIAPGGRHLVLEQAPAGLTVRLTDDPPENGCRPSADKLFHSAAVTCRSRALALVMTGMGIDGVKGLTALKQVGGHVLAQDEESSVVWGMPGSAVQAGVVDETLSLQGLARRITQLAGAR